MTDFSNCPTCGGYTAEGEPTCLTCQGTGRRQLTEEHMDLAISAKEWADEEVDRFFSEWCRISGTHHAYGVSNWEIGAKLHITQDTSCMGCASSEHHSFPLEWFYATKEERAELIKADVQAKHAAEIARRHSDRAARLAKLKKEAAALEADIQKGAQA